MRQAITRFLDTKAAERAGSNAATNGVTPNPEQFIAQRLGLPVTELPAGHELERTVCVTDEETVIARVQSIDEELTVYASPWVYLVGGLCFLAVDVASSTSVMLDLGYPLPIAILQGIMLTCSLV